MSTSVKVSLRSTLESHTDWITCIALSPADSAGNNEYVYTGSRDKSVVVWKITGQQDQFAVPKKSLRGHSHFISDIAISMDGQYGITSCWDGTARLWVLADGVSGKKFVGHKKDIMSVCFSSDNRQIFTGSRDKTIKLWNTVASCKHTIESGEKGHKDWVSCVRYSPDPKTEFLVSSSWDNTVKIWDKEMNLRHTFEGHTSQVNTIAISPDGSLCASGGKDGIAFLWGIKENKELVRMESQSEINSICFSPNRYWLCAATNDGIKIWDLETKKLLINIVPNDLPKTKAKATPRVCTCLAWSSDGATLYSGWTDNKLRIFSMEA